MRFNTKVRYGLRVMIDIALNNGTDSKGVFQKDIALRQKISFKYLDHIINSLKVAKLIVRPSLKSGYFLARPANEISLLDIERAFNANDDLQECLDNPSSCQLSSCCKARKVWSKLNSKILDFMKSTMLSDIIQSEEYDCNMIVSEENQNL